MAGSQADSQPEEKLARGNRATSNDNFVVIGLYGIPGSGKTFLLHQLEEELGRERFAFYEGSKMIANVVPGGLEAFQKLNELDKVHWRRVAINTIKEQCHDSGQAAVLAGHFMFWSEEEETGRPVYTQDDLDIFTHIIYLDVDAEVVAHYRMKDTERSRPSTSTNHLRKWLQAEKTQLRQLCLQHGILFSLVSSRPSLLSRTLPLLRDFQHHTEEYNLSQACCKLDSVLDTGHTPLKTMLAVDADRTLAAEDTGVLFWGRISNSQGLSGPESPLKTLFSSHLRYSYTAFRQAVLLYEEVANGQEFEALCQDVASVVKVYPEFVSLLQTVGEHEHVAAVVITCGLRRVWDIILEREGLSNTVKVIGGGRIADGFVVTPAVKAALVARLQNTYQMSVWAFGDSPVDLEMLRVADHAIIVVGEERTRSKAMDAMVDTQVSKCFMRQIEAPPSCS